MTYTIHGRHIIVLGDRTTHGGQVISGSMTFSYLGVPVARVGDQVTCPRCGGVHKIVEGTENTFDHDMPVAVHDCRTSCGARLIAESANKPCNPAWADGLSSPRFEAPPSTATAQRFRNARLSHTG